MLGETSEIAEDKTERESESWLEVKGNEVILFTVMIRFCSNEQ